MELLKILDVIRPDPSLDDGWEWLISCKGRFTSKSLYSDMVIDHSILFPYKIIWILGIPSRVAFLCGLYTWIKFSL